MLVKTDMELKLHVDNFRMKSLKFKATKIMKAEKIRSYAFKDLSEQQKDFQEWLARISVVRKLQILQEEGKLNT